jgi:hypothetical protein
MSKPITPADLEAMFGLAHETPHHGMCISVPADRFLPEWEPQLKQLGYYLIQSKDLQHKPIILVTREKPAERVEEEPKLTVREETSSEGSVDESLIIKLWKKKVRVSKIAKRFPGHTISSIQNIITGMQRKGLIKPRWRKKHKESKERKEIKERKEPEKTPGKAGKTLGQLIDEDPKILGQLFAKIIENIDCLECQALMHTLEVLEANGRLVIPPNLRTLYVNSLVEKSPGMRDLFKQKARHFLEVCE